MIEETLPKNYIKLTTVGCSGTMVFGTYLSIHSVLIQSPTWPLLEEKKNGFRPLVVTHITHKGTAILSTELQLFCVLEVREL